MLTYLGKCGEQGAEILRFSGYFRLQQTTAKRCKSETLPRTSHERKMTLSRRGRFLLIESRPRSRESCPVVKSLSNSEDETGGNPEEVTKPFAEDFLPGESSVLPSNWNIKNACAVVPRSQQIPHFVVKEKSAPHFVEETVVTLSIYQQAKGV